MVKLLYELNANEPRLTAFFHAAYSGMFDLAQTIDRITMCVQSGVLTVDEITVDHLDRVLWTGSSSPVDLLVRTSGEIRFSDYLLWSANFSNLCFVDFNWPDIDEFQALKFILNYQLKRIQRDFRGTGGFETKSDLNDGNEFGKTSSKFEKFLLEKERARQQRMKQGVPISREIPVGAE